MSTGIFVVFIAGVIFSSCLVLFRKVFITISERVLELLNVIIDSKLNDDEKHKALIQQLSKTLISLTKVILVVSFTVLATLAPIKLYIAYAPHDETFLSPSSGIALLIFSLASVLPFVLFNKLSVKADYSELSMLLHRMILNNENLSWALFLAEKNWMLKKTVQNQNQKFIIVTGLARAGTTAMTLSFANSKKIKSLTYANMPFLLSPNLWKKVYNPKSTVLMERSHKDNVLFGYNSAEAFEEYFWKIRLKDSYIKEGRVCLHTVSDADIEQYLCYQSILLKGEQKMYLAKNNNFMLRFASLTKLKHKGAIVLLFRSPLEQANSLLQQHIRYCKIQSENPFVLEYMNWLGHYEFGLGHKPFSLSEQDNDLNLPMDKIDYWLAQWINYYQYIIQFTKRKEVVLIEYNDFRLYPNQLINRIEQEIGVDFNLGPLDKYLQKEIELPSANSSLVEKSDAVYKVLLESKLVI